MPTLSSSSPRARIPHVCSLCGRTIQPGELYVREFGVSRRDSWTFRACLHCQMLGALMYAWLPGFSRPITAETLFTLRPETCTEARWLAQWRRKWTRQDGGLYPIPGAAE